MIGIGFLFALAFDQLPAGFAVPAGVGDLATGIAALAVVLSLGNGSLSRRRLYTFTALGVGDFLVANATGLSLEPGTLPAWPLAIFPTIMIRSSRFSISLPCSRAGTTGKSESAATPSEASTRRLPLATNTSDGIATVEYRG